MCIGNKYINFLSVVYTIIQWTFITCYYGDPCHKNPKIDCSTNVPRWKIWQVWLPSIIAVVISGVIMFTLFIRCCIPNERRLMADFQNQGSDDSYIKFDEKKRPFVSKNVDVV